MQTSITNKSHFYVGKYYEVNDVVLGCGSFSTVYLAIHKVFGTKVALKVIDTNNIQEEYVKRNLHREAEILRKLNHPNIVNFYEEFMHNELYCLALEHINGPDLSRYLKRQHCQRVSEKTAKVMFYQMVSAVHHMHQANVLHRDLKQENILLEYGKVIKIVDFGLSNTYQPKVHLRTHCGSLVYAAPELFQHGSVYGAAVDLWSLGVILYAMVVGRIPFEVSKNIKSTICHGKKERFLRRISEGLTAENWENMGHLSYDCANLLESLLQPDQFKRIRIEGVRKHPWFLNDVGLRKKLPQHRMDLKRKFEPEIIDIMADRLHKRKGFLRLHLATRDKYDRVAAMFFILQDTLVKEVLYPPKDLENTLIYQLEYRRKSQFSEKHNLPADDYEQEEECCETNKNSESYVVQGARSFSTGGRKFVSHYFIPRVSSKREIQERNKVCDESTENIRKIIGDGEHVAIKTSERNVTRRKPWLPTSNKPSSNLKSSVTQKIDDKRLKTTYHSADQRLKSTYPSAVQRPKSTYTSADQRPKSTYISTDQKLKSTYPSADQRLKSTYTSTDHRFRSYKNSRPTRVVKDQEFNGKYKERSDFENDEVGQSRSDFSNYSVKSNFQREVDSLKEKLEKDLSIASQNVNQRGYNFKIQQRTVPSVSISGYSQSSSVKRPTDVDKYTAQQIKQYQRAFELKSKVDERPNKLSQPNPNHNKTSSQDYPTNPIILSRNENQSSQMKQRSMIIRRSNTSNRSHTSNKTEVSRHHNRSQQTSAQRPVFDESRNKSNYESRRTYKNATRTVSIKEDSAKK